MLAASYLKKVTCCTHAHMHISRMKALKVEHTDAGNKKKSKAATPGLLSLLLVTYFLSRYIKTTALVSNLGQLPGPLFSRFEIVCNTIVVGNGAITPACVPLCFRLKLARLYRQREYVFNA